MVPRANLSKKGFRMPSMLARFASDESGATVIEYGLIGVLVSVGIIVGATALGSNMRVMFNAVADKVVGAG
jgi:pilus assembly protein Flp/PilA